MLQYVNKYNSKKPSLHDLWEKIVLKLSLYKIQILSTQKKLYLRAFHIASEGLMLIRDP